MRRIYIFIISCLFLFACSSGKNQFEKGNYDLAVYKAVKRLQQRPNHPKASEALQGAYGLAVKGHLDRVAFLLNTQDKFRYDRVVREFASIRKLNNAVLKYPEYASLVKLEKVEEKYLHAKKLAANVHLEEARALMQQKSKPLARRAVGHYHNANRFVQGIVSSGELSDAMDAGTERIVFLFANDNQFFKSWNAELFFNNLVNEFGRVPMRYLQILPEGMEEKADRVIEIELHELAIGREVYTERMTKMVRDNVFIGQVESDSGKMVDVYGPVKARYFEFTKSVESSAVVWIQQVDPLTGTVQRKEMFPSSFVWTDVWATYKGDRRALNKEQKHLARKGESPLPDQNWLISQATAPLVFSGKNYLVNQLAYLR